MKSIIVFAHMNHSIRVHTQIATIFLTLQCPKERAYTYIFLIRRLLASIEFAPLVYEFPTACALHGEGCHQSHRLKPRSS